MRCCARTRQVVAAFRQQPPNASMCFFRGVLQGQSQRAADRWTGEQAKEERGTREVRKTACTWKHACGSSASLQLRAAPRGRPSAESAPPASRLIRAACTAPRSQPQARQNACPPAVRRYGPLRTHAKEDNGCAQRANGCTQRSNGGTAPTQLSTLRRSWPARGRLATSSLGNKKINALDVPNILGRLIMAASTAH